MPALSPTMTQGNLVSWKKKIGDAVNPGDVIAEVETDKAQIDFECQEEGFLVKVLVQEGTKDVPISKPLAVLAENKEDLDSFKDFTVETKPAEAKKVVTPKPVIETQKNESIIEKKADVAEAKEGERLLASPVARMMAKEKGIDLNLVQGTGPKNRITKWDVQNFSPKESTQNVQAVASAQSTNLFIDIPLTNMRKVIAQRLTESKSQVPHYYLSVDIRMDSLLALREKLNAKSQQQYKLSVNDFIIKACASALKQHPHVNSSWQKDFIRQYKNADISIAVSTETGLITPIIKNACCKGIATISNEMKELAGKAKANKLQPHEFQGGSFTISNLGMFGIKNFTAIINPPQACILAVGTTEKRVVVEESGSFATQQVMNLTLSSDHRVVDGATGAKFLQTLKGLLEDPITLML
ncbi:Chloramphenicol acetyltransferase-like domain-containing protein [Rozella allomycis CSF55]|uniref:Acetyltransferase component of pyruvate dehydrogenase complex n=1 Tax=Rozella allomycis (strain CSF55) TaxID=988480 RepID=A0A075AZ43_ROZAC|nr:Chloramphenicol acetyltransferase-like domain-containing protein [Rozella allomycis CSF55]|eukprot:EPZ33982.1 Chloramphenicol acetyltransferase-like domain-containing protein [Rozella allomycis CSF55]